MHHVKLIRKRFLPVSLNIPCEYALPVHTTLIMFVCTRTLSIITGIMSLTMKSNSTKLCNSTFFCLHSRDCEIQRHINLILT